MAPEPIRVSGNAVDLSPRVALSTTVTGSPALAAETVVCTIAAIAANPQVITGVLLIGTVAYTVGTSGVSATYKIRQTGTSGTTLYSSGVTTAGIAAGNLVTQTVTAWDTAPVLPGQVYVLTLTIGSGAAASTVSAANLTAIII